MKILNNANFNSVELQNIKLQMLGADPGSVEGALYYHSTNFRPRWRSNSAWNDLYPFASANTVNTGVLRDGAGNFSAGTITATLSGNASSAASLQNSRNFSVIGKATAASVAFNGTADVALNVTALNVACSDIALTSGYFLLGNGSNLGAATTKSAIPLSGFGAAAASVDCGSQRLTNLATPLADTDAANKLYVDSMAMGFDVKASVRACSTGVLPAYTQDDVAHRLTATANGAFPTMDGVTLVVNDRILVKDENVITDANGLYYLEQVGDAGTPWKLKRTTDADSNAEVTSGLYTWVEEGTVNGDSGWILTTNNPITLETTALNFQQFSGAGMLFGGNGIVKVGNTLHFATSSAYTANKVPFASGTSSIGFTANAPTTARRVLVCASAGSPDWSTVALGDTDYVSGTLTAGNGGTGLTSFTAGDLLYATGTTTLAKRAIGSTGAVLTVSAGAPAWTSATYPGAVAQYDLLYATAANQIGVLSKVSATGALVCASTGAPAWTTTTTNYQVLQRDGAGNITFGAMALGQSAAVTGQLAMANGGSGANLTGSAGGIVWTTSATAMAVLSGTGTANKMLLSGASATPTWSTSTHPSAAAGAGTFLRSDGTNYVNSTLVLPNAIGAGELPYGSATNTMAALAAGTATFVLQCGGAGAPSWYDLFGSSNVFTAGNLSLRTVGSESWIAGWSYESDASTAVAQTKYSPAIVFKGHYWNVSDQTSLWSLYHNPKANASGGGTGGMTMVRPLVFRNETTDVAGLYSTSGHVYLHLIPTTSGTGVGYVLSAQDLKLSGGSGGGTHVNGYDVTLTGGNSDTSPGSTGGHIFLSPGAGDVAGNNGRVQLTASTLSLRLNHLAATRLVHLDANKDLVTCGYDMPSVVTTGGRLLQVSSATTVVESSYALPFGALTTNQIWVSGSTTQVAPVTPTSNSILWGNGAGALAFLTATANQVLRADGSGVPGFGAIALNSGAAVTGTLAAGNGGTGSAFFAVAGPTALRTYTFPDATCTLPRIMAADVTGTGAVVTLDVVHNFGTRDLLVQVRETSGSYDVVYPDIEQPDTNTVRLRFLTPPANGYVYRVIIVSK